MTSDAVPDSGASPPAEVTVRPAATADVDAVLRLWAAAGAQPTVTDDASSLEMLLNSGTATLFVAVSGHDVVGSVIAAWDGWRGSLYRVAVHPAHRRRGIANALVGAAVDSLRERGARRIGALVVAEEPDAVAFWDSLARIGVVPDPHPKLRYVVTDPG